MSQLTAVFRANEGLIVVAGLCFGTPFVLTLVALIMRAAGASLRPVTFIAVLVAPIVLSFLLVELIRARRPAVESGNSPGLSMRDGRFANPERLFGPGISAELIRDARPVFPEFLNQAVHAELAIVGTGETILAAQFSQVAAAKEAAAYYWRTFRLKNTSGDEERGWRGKRELTSDFVEMLRSGPLLFIWTAPTKEACAARRAASGSAVDAPEVRSAPREPLFPSLQPLGSWLRRPAVKGLGLFSMVALYVVWFFKGAAWASGVPANPGVPAGPGSQLMARLENLNTLDVPYRVERGSSPNECLVTWRYADAKWVDHARAHGLRRTFRIRLTLDEAAHVVRATDSVAEYDWSAGRDGARIEWKASTGVVFFQLEKRRVFGLQLDDQGRFKPELAYSYAFNLPELKAPLIEAVTTSGWRWRPVVWQGPVWLRWLTE